MIRLLNITVTLLALIFFPSFSKVTVASDRKPVPEMVTMAESFRRPMVGKTNVTLGAGLLKAKLELIVLRVDRGCVL